MRRELKAKGERKSFRIALDLLIQVPDLYSVEFCEIRVEDDSLPTENENFSNQLFLRSQLRSLPYLETRSKLEVSSRIAAGSRLEQREAPHYAPTSSN